MKKFNLLLCSLLIAISLSCTIEKQEKQPESASDTSNTMTNEPTKFNQALTSKLNQQTEGRLSVIIQTHDDIDDEMLSHLREIGLKTHISLNKKITADGTAESILKLDDIPWIRAVELSQTRNTK